MEALKNNKAAQFILGAAVIFVSYKLWTLGWFSYQLGVSGDKGLSSPVALLPLVVDTVCFVGIAGFTILQLAGTAVGWIRSAVAGGGSSSGDSEVGDVDATKLANYLDAMSERIKKLEAAHPELAPVEPPTMEDLLKLIEDLKKQIGGKQ